MLLARPFIQWIGKELTRRLARSGACEIKDPAAVAHAMDQVIYDSMHAEEEVNDEARALLDQYAEYMRQNNITYTQMFNKVKKNILAERKITSAASRDGDTKIARDKILELSHQIAAKLPRLRGLRVAKGWNETRLEIGRELTNIFLMEKKIDDKARDMIARQQRDIPEGSEEWQVLHRRYYEQEMARIGVDMRSPEVR
jgi:hypothetical protein